MTTVVKKYANRRLYDPEESRYITLDELAEKIRGGADVRVVDAKTGEDLTQGTLAQIILESRNAARLLPVPLLVQLVRMGDAALAEFFGRYVSMALEIYQTARQGAQATMPWNPFANMPFAATNALARLLVGGSPWGPGAVEAPPPAAPPAPAAAAVNDTAEEVAGLRRELEALKSAFKRSRRR
jgi:polyhydroxyalkanoate synthesis repressor PhaR